MQHRFLPLKPLDVFGDPMTTALPDRLAHRCPIVDDWQRQLSLQKQFNP